MSTDPLAEAMHRVAVASPAWAQFAVAEEDAVKIAREHYAELVAAAVAMLDHDTGAHGCDSAAAGRVRAALDRSEARP